MSQRVWGGRYLKYLSGLAGLVCGGIFLATLYGTPSIAVGEAESNAAVMANGEELFQLCAQCHGVAGEGNPTLNAPGIAGREAWYLQAQLEKFREGYRGLNARDVAGMMMAPMARSLRTPEDIAAVVAYTASLPVTRSADVLLGDPKKGAQLFLTCQACHGENGKGVAMMKAPNLVGLEGWYIKKQLENFKAGIRGAHPKDSTGMQMRAMSLTLSNDAAVQDVTAFIQTMQ